MFFGYPCVHPSMVCNSVNTVSLKIPELDIFHQTFSIGAFWDKDERFTFEIKK